MPLFGFMVSKVEVVGFTALDGSAAPFLRMAEKKGTSPRERAHRMETLRQYPRCIVQVALIRVYEHTRISKSTSRR
jgi:hypothetical protein